MGGYITIIANTLHIPALRCPLYSIRSHSRIRGCGFHADYKGTLLAFPTFVLPVDLSYDCVIKGSFPSFLDMVHFDERLVGSISAVSDNTRNCHKRRGCLVSPTAHCHVAEHNDSPVSLTVTCLPPSEPVVVENVPTVVSEPIFVEDVNEDDESLCGDASSSIDDNVLSSSNLPADNDSVLDLMGELGLDPTLLISSSRIHSYLRNKLVKLPKHVLNI